MCGIVALIRKRANVAEAEAAATGYNDNELIVKATMNSLRELLNRGYDSIGLGAVSADGEIALERTCVLSDDVVDGLVRRMSTKAGDARCCVGHSRWATHGGKNTRNAHPHVSMRTMFALVHNGIIENYRAFKRKLTEEHAYRFRSDTDSEVIVNMIEHEYTRQRDGPGGAGRAGVVRAIESVMAVLSGTYGLAVVCVDTPDDVYVCKSGSPILVGENDSCIMASSEVSGFRGEINYYISLPSKRVAVLSADDGILLDAVTALDDMGERLLLARNAGTGDGNGADTITSKGDYTVYCTEGVRTVDSPHPYDHWMLKELMEQPETIMNAINNGARVFDGRIRLGGLSECALALNGVTAVVLLGCGTSLYACQCARAYFLSIGKISTVGVYDAAAFTMADMPKDVCTLVCVCSQSGETMDVLRCLEMLRRSRGGKQTFITLGVINVVDSQIAREVDCGVYMNAGREVSVASTKSYTASLVVLYMISVWLNALFVRGHSTSLSSSSSSTATAPAALAFETDAVDEIRHLVVQMRQLVTQSGSASGGRHLAEAIYERYKLEAIDHASLFVLGRGKMESVARECALKFKEICYIHAEGCHAGSLKHGPFALLTDGFPVVLLVERDSREKMLNTYEELRSRGSHVFVVTNCVFDDMPCSDAVYLPYNHSLSEVLFANFMHTMAYAMAVRRGINPDRPRNLAKVVTVE